MRGTTLFLIAIVLAGGCGQPRPGHPDRPKEDGALRSSPNPGFPAVVSRRIVPSLAAIDPSWNFYVGDLSPDGRNLIIPMVDSLVLLDLASRTQHRVPHDLKQGSPAKVVSFPVFSPDAKRVAVLVREPGRAGQEVRVVNVDGTETRTLFRTRPEVTTYLNLADWSLDGSQLVVTMQQVDGSNQLALMSVRDGAIRVLKSFDWRGPQNPKLSADGKYIGYAVRLGENTADMGVFVIATDGAVETRITNDGGRMLLLGWSASSDAILYATENAVGASVWRVPVREGRRTGATQLVRADIAGFSLDPGLTRVIGDALYHEVWVGGARQQVFEMSVDFDNGTTLSAPSLLSEPSRREPVGQPVWSPDGTRLTYVSGVGPGGGGGQFLIIRTIASGEEREIKPGLEDISLPRWSPDGSSLILRGRRIRRAAEVGRDYRYDLKSGALQLLPHNEVYSADGLTQLAYEGIGAGASPNRTRTLIVRDVKAGIERTRLQVDSLTGAVSASPKGDRIAFIYSSGPPSSTRGSVRPFSLRILPIAESGEVRILLEDTPERRIHNPGALPVWTPDGRHLLVITMSADMRSTITAVPVAGGEARQLLTGEVRLSAGGSLSVHPDGRRIAFTGSIPDPNERAELWVMENLTPPPSRPSARKQ
jgi:Tol biopolymer transport system component